MTLIKRNSFLPVLPHFFDDFFTRDLFDWNDRNYSKSRTTLPSVNIIESNDDFRVEMAAPGMNKEDFQIELDNEILKISSDKQHHEEMQEGARYSRHEFSYQAFHRSFHLPKSVVDESKIQATYDNGILRILIPKKEEARALPPRRIEIG